MSSRVRLVTQQMIALDLHTLETSHAMLGHQHLVDQAEAVLVDVGVQLVLVGRALQV